MAITVGGPEGNQHLNVLKRLGVDDHFAHEGIEISAQQPTIPCLLAFNALDEVPRLLVFIADAILHFLGIIVITSPLRETGSRLRGCTLRGCYTPWRGEPTLSTREIRIIRITVVLIPNPFRSAERNASMTMMSIIRLERCYTSAHYVIDTL